MKAPDGDSKKRLYLKVERFINVRHQSNNSGLMPCICSCGFFLKTKPMNHPINDDELNRILLKPRFKYRFNESETEIMDQFRNNLQRADCVFLSRFVDHHIVIDVPENEEHFWSPQLHVEIEKEGDLTVVKGILGPRPKIWTFFMFLHFAVAVAFFVFFVIFYSKWSLDQDYELYMILCLSMPVVWVALYFVGQLGKKFGYKQMLALHGVLSEALKNFKQQSF